MEMMADMGSDWINKENSKEYDWFKKMVNAYKDLKEDESPPEGSTIMFAKQLKAELKVDKLTKSKIVRNKKSFGHYQYS
ncbi:hypothetical protein Tco_0693125 [Tanacetum coccineum]